MWDLGHLDLKSDCSTQSRLLCITCMSLLDIFLECCLYRRLKVLQTLILLLQTVFVVLLKFLEMQWNIVSDPP